MISASLHQWNADPRGAMRTVAAALGLTFLLLGSEPAEAQSIVAFVNGQPITALDVDQRARIMEAFTRTRPDRKTVLDELINDKVKLRQANKLQVEVTDAQVDKAFATMARSSGRDVSDLSDALRQAGIDSRAFKSKLRVDLAWRDVLQQMAPGTFQVRDADVVAALVARGQSPNAKAFQYTLQQIVFVVPRGSPAAVTEKRMREAEALRAKFSDCQADLALAREYSEVVIKEPVIRISTDLPQRLQQLLEKTPDGKMTPPETTAAGIEVVAVCNRKETVADLGSRNEIRDKLLSSRLEAQEKQILERLRRQAIIEYR
jgi:peptidyl-prolyl cis-trans isomerase SurA